MLLIARTFYKIAKKRRYQLNRINDPLIRLLMVLSQHAQIGGKIGRVRLQQEIVVTGVLLFYFGGIACVVEVVNAPTLDGIPDIGRIVVLRILQPRLFVSRS